MPISQEPSEPEEGGQRVDINLDPAPDDALHDGDHYYIRRGSQFGAYVIAAWDTMMDEPMPRDVAAAILVAWVHSKRERGLW